MRTNKQCLVLVFFAFLSFFLSAQTVDRDEFEGILDTVINFVNYRGPHSKVDTLQEIYAIGEGLAANLSIQTSGRSGLANRYQVLHILGSPDEVGKPADILIFGKDAGVDHIDNVRRILASYLRAQYQYSQADANLLAFYISIYNAVYRGNLVYMQSRYKASVIKELHQEKIGLALNWNEWAGNTEIIIPLGLGVSSVDERNSLSSISAAELVGPEVLETVRDKPGDTIAPRQEMADLIDRTVDQEQAAIEQDRALLEEKKQAQNTADANNSVTSSNAANTSDAKTASDSTTTSSNESNSSLAQANSSSQSQETGTENAQTDTNPRPEPPESQATTTNDLAQEEKALDQREAQNQELADAGEALRKETAQDLKDEASKTQASENRLFLKTRFAEGLYLSDAQLLNSASLDAQAQASGYTILNRQVLDFGDQYLALIQDGSNAALALIDKKTLELYKKGSNVISPYSQVLVLSQSRECLAVMQEAGEWYLCRFDNALNPLARSKLAVDPFGVLSVSGNEILVQRKDGRPSTLNIDDLGTAR